MHDWKLKEEKEKEEVREEVEDADGGERVARGSLG